MTLAITMHLYAPNKQHNSKAPHVHTVGVRQWAEIQQFGGNIRWSAAEGGHLAGICCELGQAKVGQLDASEFLI